MGKGMACGWPALSGHWLPITGCWQYLVGVLWLMFGLLFLHLCTFLGCFCPRTLVFLNNGLGKLPWTSSISYLYAKLRIINRNVSGLATDSPCNVWGRGWTTRLLFDGLPFGLHILKQLVCRFGIVERSFTMIYFSFSYVFIHCPSCIILLKYILSLG